MKVVIAIDSFKGSLGSHELSNQIKEGVLSVYKDAEIITIPIADGGEGTVQSLVDGTRGQLITTTVNNPLMSPINAHYGIIGSNNTAVIEMAQASGLPLIDRDKRNPLLTTTYGTGELIKDAINRGCRDFIIGIGGSATNDGGMGMLNALGFQFFNDVGELLEGCGKSLSEVTSIDTTQAMPELKDCSFLIACDVDNPFFGPHGAAHIYAPQKGADEAMVNQLDKGLKSFASLIKTAINKDIAELPGAGAAGGLGGGFVAFLNAELRSGIDIVLDTVGFNEAIENADFVITGEGKIDGQSVCGKAPTGVSQRCAEKGIAVIAQAGCVDLDTDAVHDFGITSLFSILNEPLTLKDAMLPEKTAFLIKKNTEQLFRLIAHCDKKFSSK